MDRSATEKKVLLIFLKNNERGKVKTRLAKTVGDEKALQIYKKLKAYTFTIASQTEAEKQLWFSDFLPPENALSLPPSLTNYTLKLQEGSSLGERMKRGFKQVFEDGYSKAVIIGSDCAQLKVRHLKNAFDALATSDVVIGPARDGGYYLLGMNSYLPNLFEGIDWSSQWVYKQTINRIEEGSHSYASLEMLNDVDTEDDWLEVEGSL